MPTLKDEHRAFLEDLRKSGAVNMYAATPFLQERFDLDRDEASKVLVQWMIERHRINSGVEGNQ